MKLREIAQLLIGIAMIFALACVVAFAVVYPVYVWESW